MQVRVLSADVCSGVLVLYQPRLHTDGRRMTEEVSLPVPLDKLDWQHPKPYSVVTLRGGPSENRLNVLWLDYWHGDAVGSDHKSPEQKGYVIRARGTLVGLDQETGGGPELGMDVHLFTLANLRTPVNTVRVTVHRGGVVDPHHDPSGKGDSRLRREDIDALREYAERCNADLDLGEQNLPHGFSDEWRNCTELFFAPHGSKEYAYLPQWIFYAHACANFTTASAVANEASLRRLVEVAAHRLGLPRSSQCLSDISNDDWGQLLSETCSLLALTVAYRVDSQGDFKAQPAPAYRKSHRYSSSDSVDQWDTLLVHEIVDEMAGDCEDVTAMVMTVAELLRHVPVPTSQPLDLFGALCLYRRCLIVCPTTGVLMLEPGQYTYHAFTTAMDAQNWNDINPGCRVDRTGAQEEFNRRVRGVSDAKFGHTCFYIEGTEHVTSTPNFSAPPVHETIFRKACSLTKYMHIRVPHKQMAENGYQGVMVVYTPHLRQEMNGAVEHHIRGKHSGMLGVRPRHVNAEHCLLTPIVATPAEWAAAMRVTAHFAPISKLARPPSKPDLPVFNPMAQVIAHCREQDCDLFRVSDILRDKGVVERGHALVEVLDCIFVKYSILEVPKSGA